MPAAYLMVEMKINDIEAYRAYLEAAPAAVAAYGGEYLVRGGRQESLEGDWRPDRLALVRFPSYEQAKAFYDSELYRAARAKRSGLTDYFNMMLVEGVDAPPSLTRSSKGQP